MELVNYEGKNQKNVKKEKKEAQREGVLRARRSHEVEEDRPSDAAAPPRS